MFFYVNLLIFGFIVLTESLDRRLFSVVPLPDPTFTLDRWKGEWFVQARFVPASFIGSVEFTDFRFTNILERDRVLSPHSWRDGETGECAGANFFAIYTSIPGAFKLKDTIGNTYSGDWVVVVLDSNLGLDISYGCTKRALDKRCFDPWVSVKTRDRNPPAMVMKYAENLLMKLFGLTLSELEPVPQGKSCYSDRDRLL